VIYAKPGKEFEGLLENAPVDLVGTLATRIDTAAGAPSLPRSTAGITEPVGGNYLVKRVAPSTEGSYLLVWDKDPDGGEVAPADLAIEQLQVTRVLPFESVVGFLPEPSDIASLLRARTYLDSGEQEGEFTEETRPTEAQVATLINSAANEVAARLGQEIEDETIKAYARNIVAIRTAMSIELSYFPEQADEDATTVYKELKSLYESELANLLDMLPDTSATKKGFYSLRMRSEVSGVFPTSELLP
jgi:hypothetical protein